MAKVCRVQLHARGRAIGSNVRGRRELRAEAYEAGSAGGGEKTLFATSFEDVKKRTQSGTRRERELAQLDAN